MSSEGEGRSDQHQMHPMRAPESGYPYEDEINLLDYWRILWAWRWMIAGLCVVGVSTAMVKTLMLPKVYSSTVTMMSTAQNAGGGLNASQNAVLKGLLGGDDSGDNMVMALLESRTMGEDIARNFDLVTLFGSGTVHSAARTLKGMTEIENMGGVISISVEASDPDLAANIANYYVESLDHMSQSMSLTTAKRNRVFIEERLVETKRELRGREEEMKAFQLNNMSVFYNEQRSGSMQEALSLQNRISGIEVELKVKESYLESEHPDVIRLSFELRQLKKKLIHVETARDGNGDVKKPGSRLFPPWTDVPDLSMMYDHLTRNVAITVEVYRLLSTQLEQAKISEVKNDPTVQILDPALPPTEPMSPPVKRNMLIVGFVALFVGAMLAFILDFVRRMAARPKETA